MDAWTAQTRNLIVNPHNGLAMANAILDAIAVDGREPEEYITAFVEWQKSCPPGRRPQLAPHKLVENFAAVQEWLRGERKAPPPESSEPKSADPKRGQVPVAKGFDFSKGSAQ